MKKNILKFIAALTIGVFILGLFPVRYASAAGYSYYRSISVQSSQVPSTQSNFTWLVCANSTLGNGNTCPTVSGLNQSGAGAHVQNSNGYDITFWTSSSCTGTLNWEMEKYVASTGEMIAWVKSSSLSNGSQIYMCYGNSSISSFQGGSTGSAWDSSYLGVWHLPNGSSLASPTLDSTTNGNNGAIHSSSAGTGQFDGGVSLSNSSTNYVDFGNNSSLNSGAFTYEIWVKGTSFPNGYNVALSRNGSGYAQLMVKSNGKLAIYISTTAGDADYDGNGSHTLSTGTWYMLTVSYNNSVGTVGYVNAASDNTVGAHGTSNALSNLLLANDAGSSGRNWNGAMDEPRISNVARSADWITSEYNNESAPSSFEAFGTETPIGGALMNMFLLMFFKRFY